MIRPTFQAQNPAISGYPLGWLSCTCYAGAMAAAFDQGKSFVMSGGAVRTETGDREGGTTLAQVDQALYRGWGVNLNSVYRLPWADFAKQIDAGKGAILQGWYAPIADSRFDAGRGFRGNHAITVLPGWIGMDPLADGRASGVYKYHGEAYPQALLKSFAGKLNIGGAGYTALGAGLVYASLTRDKVAAYAVSFTGGSFWVYRVSGGVITGRYAKRFSGPTSAPCGPPRLTPWSGHSSRSLVRMTKGALVGEYVGIPQSTLKLEVVP